MSNVVTGYWGALREVVVTGGSGFIGQHVLRNLVIQGYTAYSLSRKDPHITGVTHIPADITQSAMLPTEFRTAAVVHTAALHAGPAGLVERVNVQGTRNALHLNPDGPFVHISSSAIYNMGQASQMVREEEFSPGHYRFYNAYGASRAAAEICVLEQTAFRTRAPISLRPHGLYGPGKVTFLSRPHAGTRGTTLTLPAGGRVLHTVTHIDALVRAVTLALNYHPRMPDAFNINDGAPVFLADLLKRQLGPGLRILNMPMPAALAYARLGGMSEYTVRRFGCARTYDIMAAHRVLGYRIRRPFPAVAGGPGQ